ncbi:hypothetical protein VNO78_25066 [Psophocarpus tetragonolobus]|uniref:Uncharacterized protein n=1 Tax=Psophocarpus tetragonolobus TaxID=3891 RepID=A0AAN9XEQ2_PSOTE
MVLASVELLGVSIASCLIIRKRRFVYDIYVRLNIQNFFLFFYDNALNPCDSVICGIPLFLVGFSLI